MNKNLLVMVLLLVILAMAVPLTNYLQSDEAFTYNNIISIQSEFNY